MNARADEIMQERTALMGTHCADCMPSVRTCDETCAIWQKLEILKDTAATLVAHVEKERV